MSIFEVDANLLKLVQKISKLVQKFTQLLKDVLT
jgi:hypothetical protein